jgi:hypothetical protein
MLNIQSYIVVYTNRGSKLIHTNMRLQKLIQLSPTYCWETLMHPPHTVAAYLLITHLLS